TVVAACGGAPSISEELEVEQRDVRRGAEAQREVHLLAEAPVGRGRARAERAGVVQRGQREVREHDLRGGALVQRAAQREQLGGGGVDGGADLGGRRRQRAREAAARGGGDQHHGLRSGRDQGARGVQDLGGVVVERAREELHRAAAHGELVLDQLGERV